MGKSPRLSPPSRPFSDTSPCYDTASTLLMMCACDLVGVRGARLRFPLVRLIANGDRVGGGVLAASASPYLFSQKRYTRVHVFAIPAIGPAEADHSLLFARSVRD